MGALAVIAPAAGRLLTTVETIMAELGLSGADGAARAAILIGRASGMIAAYCGQDFARQTYRETFRPAPAGPLILSRRPAAVSTVTADGATVTPADYDADSPAGLVWRFNLFGECHGWPGSVAVVTYVAGYVLPGDPDYAAAPFDLRLPPEVEHACILTAAALQAGTGRDPMLRSENVEGVGSTSWIATAEMGALPPQAADLLARHRRGLWG